MLDTLLHGQVAQASSLEEQGVELLNGDLRDPAARARALEGVDEVVNLAAIVGDPACARDPEVSQELNVDAACALANEAQEAGVRRFVFASTCSNYGRMADPTVPIDEEGELAPVSLYARQKVAVEEALLGGEFNGLPVTCLRFATVYGVAPRMRFDLTVNEFTRDLWADRELEVFGEQFWRPYVHVRDAGRGIRAVLEADDDKVVGEVQRCRARRHRHGVLRAQLRGERFLELLRARSERQPAGPQRFRHGLDVLRREPEVEQRDLRECSGSGHPTDPRTGRRRARRRAPRFPRARS